MKKITTILILTAITIAAITCKKTPEIPTISNKIVIGETTIDSVAYFTTKVSTTIEAMEGSIISQYGHCWRTEQEPTISDSITAHGKLTQPKTYSSELTNLTNNTTYYVRSYVTYANGTVYGSEQSIQTLKTGKPIVEITQVTDVTLHSAVCGGIVQADSGLVVTTRGICWDTDSIFTITNCLDTTIVGNDLGSFTSNITGLNEGVTYYATAYATNKKGTSYGEVKMFTTIPITTPTVTTTEITEITTTSATSGGNVTSNGNGNVTARGVCWNTTGDPSLENNIGHTSDGDGMGSFTSLLTNLAENTTYYVIAYATNEKGSAYGQIYEISTLSLPCGEYTINYGGQLYHTIQIGNQCWMKENLNIGLLINGIEEMQDNQTIEKYCYDDDVEKCDRYGGLYQWDEMMQYTTMPYAQGICPLGWHVPTEDDWCTLKTFIDPTVVCNSIEFSGIDVGYKMKSTYDWNYNGNGSDIYGFTALPDGDRYWDGTFKNLQYDGYWWSSTEYDSSDSWTHYLFYNSNKINRNHISKGVGTSVRCIRN